MSANRADVQTVIESLRRLKDVTELDQHVLWCEEVVGGRKTKRPYTINGRPASSTDPSTWSSFEDAAAAWLKRPGRYNGLGFVLMAGGGLVCIDIDQGLEADGQVKPWCRGVVERFSDTAIEISPSGAGLHIWARGSLPANLPGVAVGDGHFEMYQAARYITLTGRLFRQAPPEIVKHDFDLDLLYKHLHLTAGKKVKDWPLQPLSGGRIPHGQQHSTLVSIAGTLRARKVCDEAILACLLAVNARQCEQPGPVANIERIVRSTRNWRPA